MTFAAPPEEVFDYLADPRNRPAWQTSLRAVKMLDEDGPRVGQRWRDLTWAGVRPHMRITQLQRPTLWAETGSWFGVSADLTLRFEPEGAGTAVSVEMDVRGTGPWRWPAGLADRLADGAVAGDLRRAADLLGGSSAR
ncbi:hypothetical protein GCM10011519_17870 [Marmoricola endophyticus]|uniref:SRPBCC family protein n=1 Tax=Marmoricola endophyticus TaxID=2040280 RepID=A0A917BGQ3_9ACTN|nr:hypothetical protein GCM10011519_17870 [Marmoricola endophyticus]